MTNKIIIAGFGGQGIILTGKILAHCALVEGNEVTHFASYGAEMRGGTCNCFVIISDKTISSPIVENPDIELIFNQPSKNKFEKMCKNNGTIIINNSLVTEKANRNDLIPYYIDASNIATNLGNIKITNMVMIGAFLKITGLIKLETVINSLSDIISSRNKSLIDLNIKALEEGYKKKGMV